MYIFACSQYYIDDQFLGGCFSQMTTYFRQLLLLDDCFLDGYFLDGYFLHGCVLQITASQMTTSQMATFLMVSCCRLLLLMFQKFLVTDQFYNKIAVQIKIPLQMNFFEYFKKSREVEFKTRSWFKLKLHFKWNFMNIKKVAESWL